MIYWGNNIREEVFHGNQNCKDFIWFILDGVFHSFPYLHIIAVKKENRKLGVGKKLLEFFEDICFKDHGKLFLVVADFNPDAKMIYERIGYIEVGIIPGLYRDGITEYLMMKVREEITDNYQNGGKLNVVWFKLYMERSIFASLGIL